MKVDSKKYLALYDQENYLFNHLGPAIKKRGFIKFDEFYKICMWKSARQKPKYIKNKNTVEKLTRTAFQLKEDEKMKMLCKLKGVGIPTASALLAIVYPKKYPIIDVRCVYMLKELRENINKSITINNWLKYLRIMRNIAKENMITPRELDKVLFAMHKEKLEADGFKNLYK